MGGEMVGMCEFFNWMTGTRVVFFQIVRTWDIDATAFIFIQSSDLILAYLLDEYLNSNH